jgi:hypothetical protein
MDYFSRLYEMIAKSVTGTNPIDNPNPVRIHEIKSFMFIPFRGSG